MTHSREYEHLSNGELAVSAALARTMVRLKYLYDVHIVFLYYCIFWTSIVYSST